MAEGKNIIIISNNEEPYRLVEIHIHEILSYIPPKHNAWCNKYTYGGFYLIKNISNGKEYVGKSMDYMKRLRQHLHKCNNKTQIDIALNDHVNSFKLYLIIPYERFNINYFNRELEVIIENRLIGERKSYSPYGYNISYYGHI